MKGIDFYLYKKESTSIVEDYLIKRFQDYKVQQPYPKVKKSIRVDFIEKIISFNRIFEPNFKVIDIKGCNDSLDKCKVVSSANKFITQNFGIYGISNCFRTRDINYNFVIKRKCETHLVDASTKIMLFDFNKPIIKIKQNFKQMEISKTQVLKINGKKREVTLVVLTEQNKIKAGYSVRVPGDKKNEQLGKSIAKGRALKPKTNLIDMELGKGLDRKFILYAIADDLFKKIERGIIEIKGIK